jgi:hypothetical protein
MELHTNKSLMFTLRLFATVMAMSYSLLFFFRLMWRYSHAQYAGLDVDLMVPQNPQFVIALSLVTAAISLWALRDMGRIIASLLFFGIVALKFVLWANSTRQIKINTGLNRIPQSDWVGNALIGAGRLELLALLAILSLLAFAICSIWLKREKISQHQHRFRPRYL